MAICTGKIIRRSLFLLSMACAHYDVFATWPVIDIPNLTARTLQRIEEVNKTNQQAKQVALENQKQAATSDLTAQIGSPVQGNDANALGPAPITGAQNGLITAQLQVNQASATTLPDGSTDDPYSTYLSSTDQWRNQLEALRAKLNQLILMENGSANDLVTWIGIESEMSILGTEIATEIASENDAAALAKQRVLIQITEKRTQQADDKRDSSLMKDTAP